MSVRLCAENVRLSQLRLSTESLKAVPLERFLCATEALVRSRLSPSACYAAV